ncbi:hypothetical protein [Mucispirillum schaedleri]|uniref:hypothetical protein n=1 Tax=Mucispirillum schaedleri TaxID=248039 RepID=UPI001F56A6EF|nr:hypothetical protein [Mucispirillum schaedleri]
MSKSKGVANYEDLTSEYNALNFIITSIIKSTVNTCYAVTVTKVDADNQKVTVKPLIVQIDADNNKIELSEIFEIPYFRYSAGRTAVKLDPVAGDIGVLIIFKSDSNNIKTGDNSQILPNTFLNYPLYSGIYIGGMLNNDPENYIEIKDDSITINANKKIVINCQTAEINADSEVNINSSKINLGENASLALINEKITDALNQHTHNYINTAGTLAPTTPPLVPFNTAQYSNPNIKEIV